MQSNTAEIGNRPDSLSSFPVKKRTYKPDPFTIKDGRFVGSDGFVVPNDFEELHKRFPDYVRRWVSKHTDGSTPREDLEDWTQELLIHLCHLPPRSKHRKAGKEDIVQTFDPLRHYGANEARFRNYINLCLANKFRTMHSKRMKDALSRPGNFSLGVEEADEDLCSVDELCHKHSAHLRAAQRACQKQSHDRAFLREFLNFVRRGDPKVLPAMESILATGTQTTEAAKWLGITESEFAQMRNRLGQLGECFLSGKPVPKQQRPYKKHSESSACELVG
jgi:hypothetical protein